MLPTFLVIRFSPRYGRSFYGLSLLLIFSFTLFSYVAPTSDASPTPIEPPDLSDTPSVTRNRVVDLPIAAPGREATLRICGEF
jgi:hypothetical protein